MTTIKCHNFRMGSIQKHQRDHQKKVFYSGLPSIIRTTRNEYFLDASQAAGSVLTAVSEGNLTPTEATLVMGLIDSYRHTLELTEIEERLQAL